MYQFFFPTQFCLPLFAILRQENISFWTVSVKIYLYSPLISFKMLPLFSHSLKHMLYQEQLDGERPDGMSVFPWRNGRTLVLAVTLHVVTSHSPTSSEM